MIIFMDLKKLLSQIPRDSLNETLYTCLRAIHRFERTKVKRFGLNYEAIFLLQFLRRRSPSKMSEIAVEMDIPISTASRVVDRLEAKGLVTRRKDETDKRIMLVFLQPGGEEIVQEVENHTFDVISKNLEGFDEAQIRAFIETAVNLEEMLYVHPD
jgi:MarR family transcriptional regulator for hemolysin